MSTPNQPEKVAKQAGVVLAGCLEFIVSFKYAWAGQLRVTKLNAFAFSYWRLAIALGGFITIDWNGSNWANQFSSGNGITDTAIESVVDLIRVLPHELAKIAKD